MFKLEVVLYQEGFTFKFIWKSEEIFTQGNWKDGFLTERNFCHSRIETKK